MESVASSQPSHYQMKSVQYPTAHDPGSHTHPISPACFARTVQYWQVVISRRAATTTALVLARYNLVVMPFHVGLEVMARLDDIQDFKQTALNYIEPGQNVVAAMSLYSDFRFSRQGK